MSRFLDKFRRTTSNRRYIPEIDGLRFLAILWVFVFHLNYVSKNFLFNTSDIFQKILTNGHLGVEMFFVISGFVLSLPFARCKLKKEKKVSIRSFFLRRLTRLEPPYFLIMISLFFFMISTSAYTAGALLPHLLASLFYVHNIVYPGTLPVINSVAWSLEIEIQFYILVPLLAQVFTIGKTIRRLTLSLFIVLMPIIQHFFKIETLFFYQFIQYFISGFLLADIYLSYEKDHFLKSANQLWKQLLGISGGLILAAILLIHSTRDDLLYTLFIPWMMLTFFFIVLFVPIWKRLFSIPWISVIGGMCYTIYLIHKPVLSTFLRFFIKLGITESYYIYFLIQFLIMGTLTMIFSALFFYYIEKPTMQKGWYRPILKQINTKLTIRK